MKLKQIRLTKLDDTPIDITTNEIITFRLTQTHEVELITTHGPIAVKESLYEIDSMYNLE